MAEPILEPVPVVKPWYLSKTIILNMVMGLASTVAIVWPGANVVTGWLNANLAVLTSAWGVLGVLLRFITKDKVQLGD